MAKESLKQVKERIGYQPKAVQPMCSNCVHFSSDYETINNYGTPYKKEVNIRCFQFGFATKKTAKCNLHQFKTN